MNPVVCERIGDCIQIRLASGPTNVLTTDVVRALSNALSEAERDARGVLLCGGDKFFSNGVDLDWALAQSSAGMRAMFLELGYCVLRIMESPLPIVGVIKGHAIGAAMALLLACDYRYASKGRVLIGKPEILLGVPNPYFADQLVRFIAGDFVASDLIYTGKLISGEEALAQKLIHGVAEKTSVETIAWEQLKFLCELAPEAFAETKNMRSGRFCADVRQQMSARVARQVEIWNGEDAQSRLREAEKRLAR
ncbi:MAG: enoyl-CoA hydratase/carnithine racemase [Gammaproteobacteria bacterium]|jgi:enoyl-CoA hydratase/carnithine racemase